VCDRYERPVVRMTVDAQVEHNPEMRVSATTESAVASMGDQLRQMAKVSSCILARDVNFPERTRCTRFRSVL